MKEVSEAMFRLILLTGTQLVTGLGAVSAMKYPAIACKLWAGTMVVQPVPRPDGITMENWRPCFT